MFIESGWFSSIFGRLIAFYRRKRKIQYFAEHRHKEKKRWDERRQEDLYVEEIKQQLNYKQRIIEQLKSEVDIIKIESNPRLGVFNYIILLYNGSPCSTRRAGLGGKERRERSQRSRWRELIEEETISYSRRMAK